MVYTIEPTDHWRAGDKAYCVRGLRKEGRQIVEAGRIYTVKEARSYPGMMNDGLRLEGVDAGDAFGFCSNRFVCLRGDAPYAKQLAERMSHSWLEAYRACADARNRLKAA